VIAGAGPTGLTLAVTRACRGIKAMLIDKSERGQDSSRAIVLHAGSLLALEPLGATPLLLEHGLRTTKLVIGTPTRTLLIADFGSLPPPYPFALTIPRNETEAVLRGRLSALGGSVEWGCELIGVKQDANGVDAVIRCGDRKREVRSGYLVGADGYHSKVRETLNGKFQAGTYPVSVVLGDVRMSWPRPDNEDYFYLIGGRYLIVAVLGGGYYASLPTSKIRRRGPLGTISKISWMPVRRAASALRSAMCGGRHVSAFIMAWSIAGGRAASSSPATRRMCTARPEARA